jgi:hypothetical protein
MNKQGRNLSTIVGKFLMLSAGLAHSQMVFIPASNGGGGAATTSNTNVSSTVFDYDASGALLLFRSLLLLVAALAFAGKPPSDLPVTTNVIDYDATNTPYVEQSDGRGSYQNGVDGIVSILVANGYNHITWGDWRLDLMANPTTRTLAITFSTSNAVQPGDPGYTAAANPPYWGTQWQPLRTETKCSLENHDMHAMKQGDKFTCYALIRFPTINNVYYRLYMGDSSMPETQEMQVTCNSAGASGCNDWLLDPVPVVNADGSTSPGTTRARLVRFDTTGRGSSSNAGDFYLTYHLHVTRP